MQTDQVICFWKVLNDNFGTFGSEMILMHPFSDIDHAFPLALQHERQFGTIEGINTHVNNPSINNFIATNKRNFPSTMWPLCTRCGLQGHTIEKC